MEHSALRSPGETVTVFARAQNDSEECLVWRINDDGSFESIVYTPSIIDLGDNIYSTDIVMPDDPCTIVVLFKLQPIVIVTGSPYVFFVYYSVDPGKNIPFKIVLNSGELVTDGTLMELSNGFYYKDITAYNDSILIVDETPFPIKLPYPSLASCDDSGAIKIENNVWQLISIPVPGQKVKEYFVDRLADSYSANPEDMIEICTAYFGDENKFRSYIPGVTNPATINNFPLVYNDEGNNEITGFWVKIKDLSGIVPDISNVTFEWSR
jgi:hypothetical protein